ncbi:MAG TPA: hypothetical protein VHY08_20075 [Bacillota bacterium]|nr:hypothetical protein [Bacillota bacterium]
MAKNTYVEELDSARRMLSGMKSNTSHLTKHGIDENFIIQFERAINEATALNAEQKAFLIRPKAKIIALQKRVSVISKLTATSKKLVKLDYPKESWCEFGIMDQR